MPCPLLGDHTIVQGCQYPVGPSMTIGALLPLVRSEKSVTARTQLTRPVVNSWTQFGASEPVRAQPSMPPSRGAPKVRVFTCFCVFYAYCLLFISCAFPSSLTALSAGSSSRQTFSCGHCACGSCAPCPSPFPPPQVHSLCMRENGRHGVSSGARKLVLHQKPACR